MSGSATRMRRQASTQSSVQTNTPTPKSQDEIAQSGIGNLALVKTGEDSADFLYTPSVNLNDADSDTAPRANEPSVSFMEEEKSEDLDSTEVSEIVPTDETAETTSTETMATPTATVAVGEVTGVGEPVTEDKGAVKVQGGGDSKPVIAEVPGSGAKLPVDSKATLSPGTGGGSKGPNFAFPALKPVPGDRPLPLNADNAELLTGMVQERALVLRDAIAAASLAALDDARNRAAVADMMLGASAAAAIVTFRGEADSAIASINAEAGARIGEANDLRAATEAEFDAMIDGAIVAFEAAYADESHNVAVAIEDKAIAILAYAAGRASAVREAVPARIDRARALRDEAYRPYQTHEDSDDVKEALDEACAEAEERYTSTADETAAAIAQLAIDAAATWRKEVPPENAQLIAVRDRSIQALETERVKLKADLAAKSDAFILGLLAAAAEGTMKVEAAVIDFDAAVEVARTTAQASLKEALTAHSVAIEAAAAETIAQVKVLEANMLAEISQLHSDTRGLFDPDDARPALKQGFDAIATEWMRRSAAAEADFADACAAGAIRFESVVATAATTGSGIMADETGRFALASAAYLEMVAAVQRRALAAARIQIDAAAAIVTADLRNTAARIINALADAFAAAAKLMDDAEFKITATQNGAVYKLKKVYADAIKEALKAWYEKLGSWVWDALVAIGGAVVDFVVWLYKSVVNLLWGFIWGETAYPEAWGAGVIASVGDFVAGLVVYGDIRDLFKWGIYKPFILGEEWTWVNTMMMGVSLLGIIPLFGDVMKAIGKGGIRTLVKDLGERMTRELIEEFGQRGGAETVQRLADNLGTPALRQLTEALGPRGFRELVDAFGEQGTKALIDEIGAEAVARLGKTFGPAGLKSAVDTFTATVLRDLAGELGEKLLKETLEAVGPAAVRELVGHVGAAGLKDLSAEFTTAGLRQLLDGATGLSARGVGELTGQLGAKGLKELTDELTLPAMRELADATTGIGTSSLAHLAGALGRADLGKLVRRIKPPALIQITADMGSDRLVRTIQAAGYDNYAKAISRLRDPMAIAAESASYSARILNEAFDVTRRVGGNTATFRVGTSGAVESGEATLSQVFSGLERGGAERSAQLAVVEKAGGATDDVGGHMFGYRFLPDQNRLNIFSQANKLNNPVFQRLEDEIAEWISQGATVRMGVQLVDAAAGRPSAVRVTYRVFNQSGAEVFSRSPIFKNQAGETFTRLSREDIAKRLATPQP